MITDALDVILKPLREDAIVPKKAEPDAIGYDIYSNEQRVVPENSVRAIKTGIAIELPKGVAALVLPRSGLAKERGITVLNTPGLIDWGFRGEIEVILYNVSSIRFYIEKAHRIAQLIFVPIAGVNIEITNGELSKTERGVKGFGSTGGFC
jgi:dUTP pyrophosphatase